MPTLTKLQGVWMLYNQIITVGVLSVHTVFAFYSLILLSI